MYEYILSSRQRRVNPALACRVAFDVLDRNGIGVEAKSGRRGEGWPPPLLLAPSTLPPGTAVTATLRVELLSDDEIVEMKRLLMKLGVEELPSGPV